MAGWMFSIKRKICLKTYIFILVNMHHVSSKYHSIITKYISGYEQTKTFSIKNQTLFTLLMI